jgi:hypothetical protein
MIESWLHSGLMNDMMRKWGDGERQSPTYSSWVSWFEKNDRTSDIGNPVRMVVRPGRGKATRGGGIWKD